MIFCEFLLYYFKGLSRKSTIFMSNSLSTIFVKSKTISSSHEAALYMIPKCCFMDHSSCQLCSLLGGLTRCSWQIPEDARSNAWVSFDGKRRQQLSRGDSVQIYMSQHPLPTVNKSDQTGDWFRSLIRCLNWNERLDQKALWSLSN